MRRLIAIPFLSLFFTLACGLFVSACGRGAQEIKSPSGRTAYSIECRRTRSCMDTANATCPGGYEVITIAKDGEFAVSTTELHSPKEMMIRCKSGPHEDICDVDPLMMSNQDHARWMMDPSYCPH